MQCPYVCFNSLARIMRVTEAGLFDYLQRSFAPNMTTCINPTTKIVTKDSLTINNMWVNCILFVV